MRSKSGVSATSLFAVLSIAALLASLPLTLFEYAVGDLQWPCSRGWIIVALITFFPSFIAQLCFIHGVEILGPGRAGVFVNLVPVFASLFAVGYPGETFHLYHAVALVLGGIAMSERFKKTDN